MKNSHTFTQALITTVITFLASSALAGPGSLINSPLFTNATAEPNIMFVLDNSGSMEHVVEESFSGDVDKYNKAVTYISNCTVGNGLIPSSQTVYIYFTGGRPYVNSGGTAYTVDYNGSNNTTGQKCFDPAVNYSANIHASDGTNPFSFTALYTGNFLNWYFKYDNTSLGGSVGKNWTSTTALADRYKPGTQIRRIIARDSMTDLVTALEVSDLNIRLGLTAFYSGQGAKIFDEIKHLDPAQSTSIKNNIQSLGNGGGTPLAETLHQVGRYFIGETGSVNPGSLPTGSGINDTNGQYDGNLILHPNSGAPLTRDDDVVFDNYTAGNALSGSNSTARVTFESPIQYWCQNNFAVVMTDGLPTLDRDIPTDLKDYDNDCTGVTPSCIDANTLSTNPHFDMKAVALGYIYDDTYSPSDYFDDVAQALFEIDLRPDIDKPDPNNAGSFIEATNNVITYTIAFADQDALNNKLISDAGTQGGGEAISATDGADLVKKFSQVTNTILATTSSAAAVTFNTSTLGNDTAVYQALFTTSRWSGEINSFPVDPLTGNILFSCMLDVDANCWKASSHLDALAFNSTSSTFVDNRKILTYNPTSKKGIAFTAPADFTAPTTNEMTTDMINDLCAGPDVPLVATVGCTSATAQAKADSQKYVGQMVDYIRGDRTFENILTTPQFRTRQTVLGDIINATPVFVSTPKLPWPTAEATTNFFGATGNRYSDFQTLHKNRTKVLYAAANDGMLHGFRSETLPGVGNQGGDEVFAFIPSFIFSNQANEGLHNLAQPNYTHKYYLDLAPTFTDIYFKGKDASNTTTYQKATADWYTILIGGSRGGAKKGIFALDITDPLTNTEANAADKVLWEFTNSDDADLGYTYSKPTVALTNAVDGAGLHRWAAIFGNGYQNDNGSAYAAGVTCHAVLYVLFLDGGLDGTWTLGTDPSTADYMKIDTKVGTTASGDCNGLSTPVLADLDGDKILDRAYAGDVQGNMWAFDFTCGASGCGTSDFSVAYTQGATPKPLFIAKDSLGVAQPIMVKPNIATNQAVTTAPSNEPNLLVYFGTGQYHTANDAAATTKTNTLYAVWDRGTGGLTDDRTNSTATSSTLVGQTLTTTVNGNGEFRTITANTIDWTKKYGWYIDLAAKNAATADSEERVVVNASIRSNVIFFNTLIPNSEICGFGGSGWLMSVDIATGGAPKKTLFDSNHDGVVDYNDDINGDVAVGEKVNSIPADSSFIGDYQYTQQSDKSIGKRTLDLDEAQLEGRLSWRELRAE